ncbi:PREDICTED: uncharacterized protein LOC106932617 [Poecilia mexicana]|uniref:uncharacterized protein LOC106932617 n=1 Tax=Poecilia mexicana TaxID=48701 RepID=UPI00072E3F8C|nr:PREDICTED: uncharacterized protein LOC106932617 [Poecilia mexicana]XP_014866890.1 PREDICTED: uncharacterized protein LOC106932617 [Poecilia mexicana]
MARLALFLLLVGTGSQLAGALVFEIHIRVVEGRAVTLPCRAPNMEDPIKYLEWSRTDQKMSYIILYQDQHFYPDFQDRAFRERAVLLDRDMKEGEVSLVLRNASAADSGVYECRVVQAVGRRQKRSVLIAEPNMIIKLRVGPENQLHDDDDAWLNSRRNQEEDGGDEDDAYVQQYLAFLLPVVAVTVPLLALLTCKLFRSFLLTSYRPAFK